MHFPQSKASAPSAMSIPSVSAHGSKRTFSESIDASVIDGQANSTSGEQHVKRRRLNLSLGRKASLKNPEVSKDNLASTHNGTVASRTIAQFAAGIKGLEKMTEENAELRKRLEVAKALVANEEAARDQVAELKGEMNKMEKKVCELESELVKTKATAAKLASEKVSILREKCQVVTDLTKLRVAAREVTTECGWMTEENCGRVGKKMDDMRDVLD